MVTQEYKKRKEKSKKCPYGINFFGAVFCVRNMGAGELKSPKDLKKFPECLTLDVCNDEIYLENLKKSIKEKRIMAKNFGSAGSAKTIKDVAKASAEKAQVLVVKMINNSNLHDYPNNREDVQDTADLEKSIAQLGFTDPIEVTSFGQNDGEYMIVSGHRRRTAGVKCGLSVFPCIVKSFDSDAEVENYVLLANSQRDSAKDPLLFCKRYKMHEEYLKSINFSGSLREEVANRLGISVAQADRYNAMNKIILPVWDMVRDEAVGMSSVFPMASHSETEQLEIYNIMEEALSAGETLTRETVKAIIDGYRNGKRAWSDFNEEKSEVKTESSPLYNNGLGMGTPVSSNVSPVHHESEHNSNSEAQKEPYEADEQNTNTEAEEQLDEADEQNTNTEAEEQLNPTNNGDRKEVMTEEDKQAKRGKEILKTVEKLNTCFSDLYIFDNDAEAEEAIKNLSSTFEIVVDEIYSIAREHGLETVFKKSLESLKEKVSEY